MYSIRIQPQCYDVDYHGSLSITGAFINDQHSSTAIFKSTKSLKIQIPMWLPRKKVPVIGRKYLLGIKSATCHKEELSALKLLYIMDWRAFGSPQIPGTNLVPFHHYWERTSFTENKYYRNQELSATRNKSQTKRDMFWCFLPLTFL